MIPVLYYCHSYTPFVDISRTCVQYNYIMKSRWFHLKDEVIALRKNGVSMTTIERQYGIARSTLSGWFKEVRLTEQQRTRLMKNSQDGWAKARLNAVETHRAQKAARLLKARQEAEETLEKIEISDAVLDLAFAMLYFGEGSKSGNTSLASSDPNILRFVLIVLKRNYGVLLENVRCDLHLRMDQDGQLLKLYWSNELGVPLERFRYVAFDKRSEGKPTYSHYKGVCVLVCGQVAIQRKLMYLYNLFCERVSALDMGA